MLLKEGLTTFAGFAAKVLKRKRAANGPPFLQKFDLSV